LRDNGAGYDPGRYIASFIGFGPLEDIQLAGLVVIDSPRGLYYGGEVAARFFGSDDTDRSYSGSASVTDSPCVSSAKTRFASGGACSAAPRTGAAPGNAAREICRAGREGQDDPGSGGAAAKAGLHLIPEGGGVAVRQSVPPNAPVAEGTEITVYFEPR